MLIAPPIPSRRFQARRGKPRRRLPLLGAILYDGPSLFTGDRIVVIVTTRSTNRKTGDIPQVWILRADRPPQVAAFDGSDAAVCGSWCPHRYDPATGDRTCYVLTWQGPRSIWATWRRGRYPVATDALLRRICGGRRVRLGAYGDPAAIPRPVLDRVVAHAASTVGYTHAWRTGLALADVAMASCETPEDASDAISLGYRVFLTTDDPEPTIPHARQCPATVAGSAVTCDACGACSGAGPRRHVTAPLHGAGVVAARARVRLAVLQPQPQPRRIAS